MKTVKWALIFTGIGVAGYFAYRKFMITKKQKVTKIIQLGFSTGDYNSLMAFDDAYIDAWYKAATKNNASFTLGPKVFATKGGRVIQ